MEYSYSVPTGKLWQYTFPTGFSVRYQYDLKSGILKCVNKASNGEVLWEARQMNARGQLEEYYLGNGLTTRKSYDEYGFPVSITTGNLQALEFDFNPVTGNLNYRKDNIIGLKENFEYDNLLKSRLRSWQVEGSERYVIDYENNGNIRLKSDVTQLGAPGGMYNYGENAGPNAVTSVSLPEEDYLKEAQQQTIEYTSFNKVNNICQKVEENKVLHDYQLYITYGPQQTRKITELIKDKSGAIETKYYIGSDFEIEEDNNGNVRKLHYLAAGDGLFAIMEEARGKRRMFYIHKDHLGSYETITSEEGNLIEKLSFDPWGRRRNPYDWSYNRIPTKHFCDRGFTGHEHLDKFGLINMNGRVYDPRLGRFLSPDPVTQSPAYSQNFNKYSYALNNPLKYVDPSGNYIEKYYPGGLPKNKKGETAYYSEYEYYYHEFVSSAQDTRGLITNPGGPLSYKDFVGAGYSYGDYQSYLEQYNQTNSKDDGKNEESNHQNSPSNNESDNGNSNEGSEGESDGAEGDTEIEDTQTSGDDNEECKVVPTKQIIYERTIEYTAPIGMNKYKSWQHTYRTIYNLEYTEVPYNWIVVQINLDIDSYYYKHEYPITIERGIYFLEYGPPTFKDRLYNFIDFIMKLKNWDTVNEIIIDL